MFSQQEQAYLQTQHLVRIGTVEPNGQPDVDVVGLEFDGTYFFIRAHHPQASRKYKNVAAGHHQVSLLIDDVQMAPTMVGRGIKVHGTAEASTYEDAGKAIPYLIVTPKISWSWGIEAPTFQQGRLVTKKTVWG